jgi:hypothetical protein
VIDPFWTDFMKVVPGDCLGTIAIVMMRDIQLKHRLITHRLNKLEYYVFPDERTPKKNPVLKDIA